MLYSKEQALQLIERLDAPLQLKKHVELVGFAAEKLIDYFSQLDLDIDYNFVRIGTVIHDIGKIVCPWEMAKAGCDHEDEGERLLLELGVQPEIARVCLTHSRWDRMECSSEELIIALSGKLWKGKRNAKLETKIINNISTRLQKEEWDIFLKLDSCFENIAADGVIMLEKSRHL